MQSDITSTVISVVAEVVRRHRPDQGELHDGQALVDDLGIDSMDLAVIVATLELRTRCDPFAERVSIARVRTVGDLCRAYQSS
jgi:acyl carrier protein